jgi:hypothetical protein
MLNENEKIMKMNGTFMDAKYKSVCPQTGNSILIGTPIFYSHWTRHAYSVYSKAFETAKRIEQASQAKLKSQTALAF